MKKEKRQYERVTVLQQVEVLLEISVMSGESGGGSLDPNALNAYGPNDNAASDEGVANIHWVDFD